MESKNKLPKEVLDKIKKRVKYINPPGERGLTADLTYGAKLMLPLLCAKDTEIQYLRNEVAFYKAKSDRYFEERNRALDQIEGFRRADEMNALTIESLKEKNENLIDMLKERNEEI